MLRRTLARRRPARSRLRSPRRTASSRRRSSFPATAARRSTSRTRKCTIRSVEVRNYPRRRGHREGARQGPEGHSWLWWEFKVDNRGPEKLKIKLFVEVLDKAGKIVKSGDRSVTMDAFKSDDVSRLRRG